MIEVPQLPPATPRTHGPLVAAFGRRMLALSGWRLENIEGGFPDVPKFVMIVAPHTSNWDVPVGLMAKFALRLGCRFIAKQSLFWWPLGAFLRALGGVPVNRAAASDFVEQTVRIFNGREKLVLVITPEGTRSRVERWKSGFHRIARAAGVPVVLVSFDYSRRVVRLGPSFAASEDYEGDLARIQSHITASMARHPERY
ncbi:MAG: lysophospholipid acyltransferase family protein [Betaproteobacteria bacterium]